MGRLSVGRCGVGFVGVLADLAVWASARGLVLLTGLKRCRRWLGFVCLFLGKSFPGSIVLGVNITITIMISVSLRSIVSSS